MTIAEKLVEAAENVPKVFEAGKQAEYDRFWDDFQHNGSLDNYYAAFAGRGWSKNTLHPKYKVVPVDETYATQAAHSLFYHCNRGRNVFTEMIDFRTIAHLFDFSGVINATRMFAESLIDYIVADLSNAIRTDEAFVEYWGAHRTHITLTTSEKTIFHATTFDAAMKLTDLIFTDGSIIASSLNVGSSPLSKESIISIINALSENVTGQTLTLKKSAKEAAFTSDEWNELISPKENWTIALI